MGSTRELQHKEESFEADPPGTWQECCLSDSVGQSHLWFIQSFCFLRNQTFNLTDGAGITDPNLPQTGNFLVIL